MTEKRGIVCQLIVAAQNEGIETLGKTKEQIASELAWKLKKTS